ncbi:MAG: dCTP deaminase [Pseudonocardiales bacterium]
MTVSARPVTRTETERTGVESETTKLLESGQVGWPGELRGDGLLLAWAPRQSLVPGIGAYAADPADKGKIDQLYRPPQRQWGQQRTLRMREMFLDEVAVRSLIDEGMLGWGGGLRRDCLLLRLGNRLQPMAYRPPAVVDLTNQDQVDAMYGEALVGWCSFTLRRGELALVHADHPVALPRSVGGFIGGLSHMARLGLTVNLDTPIVDAGFNGVLTIEMFNAGPSDVILRPGMPVAKVILYRVGGGALVEPYHHVFYGNEDHLGSKYAAEFFSTPVKER